MRAYLRVDPNLADKKAGYPDGAFRAFVECLCFAEQQPVRGYFRNERLLRVLLEKRARWVPFLVGKHDLLVQDDGRVYVDGWSEWQEGDHTVADRMARLRARRSRNDTGADTPGTVTDDTDPTVTPPSSGKRLAVSGKQIAEAGGRNDGLPSGNAMGFRPRASVDDVARQEEESWLKCADCDEIGRKHPASGDHPFRPELRSVS